MKIRSLFIFLPIGVTLSLSISQGLNFKKDNDPTAFYIPANFPPLGLSKMPKVSPSGFDLGKTLFYDSRLSGDGRISCASCHQQSAAFSNLNTALSSGINSFKGTRNTPALFNLAWQKEFMWDGRLDKLELVPINALTSPREMGNSMVNVISYLKKDKAYQALFKQAFGSSGINEKNVLNALAQFTVSLVSSNSLYDQVVRKENGAQYSSKEELGYKVFLFKCNGCHAAPLFTDGNYHNNGLELNYSDIGRDSLTHNRDDLAKFKTPSLRNIEITGPYMHDGRFRTLKEVLAHYSSGIQNHKNLDISLTKNGRPGLSLSTADQENLIIFLKTLTDLRLINDKHFNMN